MVSITYGWVCPCVTAWKLRVKTDHLFSGTFDSQTVGALQPRAVTIWQSLKPHLWASFCFVYLIALSGPLLADYCLSGVFLILAFHQKHAADSITMTIQKQMKKIGTNSPWICLKKYKVS